MVSGLNHRSSAAQEEESSGVSVRVHLPSQLQILTFVYPTLTIALLARPLKLQILCTLCLPVTSMSPGHSLLHLLSGSVSLPDPICSYLLGQVGLAVHFLCPSGTV